MLGLPVIVKRVERKFTEFHETTIGQSPYQTGKFCIWRRLGNDSNVTKMSQVRTGGRRTITPCQKRREPCWTVCLERERHTRQQRR